jgi:hypothetical protein
MLDMFDSSLGDLRLSKLALQEAFFRGAEGAELKFTELCAKEGAAIHAQAAAKRLPSELDEEMRALAEDMEALTSALSGAHESRVAVRAAVAAAGERPCAGSAHTFFAARARAPAPLPRPCRVNSHPSSTHAHNARAYTQMPTHNAPPATRLLLRRGS